MDLALNNLQRLIRHKAQQTKPKQTFISFFSFGFYNTLFGFYNTSFKLISIPFPSSCCFYKTIKMTNICSLIR